MKVNPGKYSLLIYRLYKHTHSTIKVIIMKVNPGKYTLI